MKKIKLEYGYNKHGFAFIPSLLIGFHEYAWIDHKRSYSIDFLFLRFYLSISIDIRHQNPE